MWVHREHGGNRKLVNKQVDIEVYIAEVTI